MKSFLVYYCRRLRGRLLLRPYYFGHANWAWYVTLAFHFWVPTSRDMDYRQPFGFVVSNRKMVRLSPLQLTCGPVVVFSAYFEADIGVAQRMVPSAFINPRTSKRPWERFPLTQSMRSI